ncbi:hypothetical protein [Sphingomonas xinjiangensis]|uniref:Uncharacterized protein n=1 Tax=Sphingomonas xinjiangensis TaxID=643568 RepID=A0A840YRU3_9SPHN|nr:hypothetical protein [Sphingomonas xinjiangensis]MBB5712395.1 hypothetical protein [Sphingomonas xinjiangensis]
MNPHPSEPTDDLESERLALCLPERIAALSDEELRSEYLNSDAEAGDPVQNALAAELQIRNIDL